MSQPAKTMDNFKATSAKTIPVTQISRTRALYIRIQTMETSRTGTFP